MSKEILTDDEVVSIILSGNLVRRIKEVEAWFSHSKLPTPSQSIDQLESEVKRLRGRLDMLEEKKERANQCVMFPNMATQEQRNAIAESNREYGMAWFGARDEAYTLATDAVAALEALTLKGTENGK